MNNNSGEGNLAVLAFPRISEMEQFISACLKKPIAIEEIVILRQRDFSIVARMELKGEAQSIIYKKVIAPWHCEAKVMQFLKDQNLPNAVRLIGTREAGESAQILQEDAGAWSLLQYPSPELALLTGLALAQTHEAALDLTIKTNVFARLDNIERLQECFESNIFKLNALFPQFAATVTSQLNQAAGSLSHELSNSEFCLQHGDSLACSFSNGFSPE